MCDGWNDVVRGRHLKLMATLSRKVILNLPYFSNLLFHETALRLKRSKDQALVLIHYGLIKFIVFRGLNKVQIS